MSEITDAGLLISTQAELLEEIQQYQRVKISRKLSFSPKTPIGAVNPIVAEKLEEIHELLEVVHNAYDRDNASDASLVALASTIGVPRRGASRGLVVLTCNLDGSQSFAPGAIVMNVDGEPENLWENRDTITSTTAGSYLAVFRSQIAGAAAVAPAGTLTVVNPTVAGFNSATNADDATPGLDIEPISALRVRMAQSVAAGGSNTTNAIRAAVVALDGVLSCDVFENRTSVVDANGLAPHSLRVVVWDGSPGAADDDAIAQAIWDRSATNAVGSETGTAQDDNLGEVTVNFNRATASALTIAVEIESASGVAADDVKAALVAAMPGIVGRGIVLHKLASAVFHVPGVDDWATFTINGGSADLAADQLVIYTLVAGGITVTGDAT